MRAIIIFLLFSVNTYASILGDVSEVQNLPGYIELDKKSPFYNGVFTSKTRKYGAQRKTPSQIVSTFFQDGMIENLKLQQFIHHIDDFKDNIKISLCMEKLRGKIDS